MRSLLMVALLAACGGSEWSGSGEYSVEVTYPQTQGTPTPVVSCLNGFMTGSLTMWTDGPSLGGIFDLCGGHLSGEVGGRLLNGKPEIELRVFGNGVTNIMLLRSCMGDSRGWDCLLSGNGIENYPATLRRLR